MPTIHLTTGLPASGKSTLARDLVNASGGGMRRVNMDDLRLMLDNNNGSRRLGNDHEETVLRMQDHAVELALSVGQDIVVDNTHLSSRIPNRIKRIAAGRATFVVHDFTDVPLDECLRRDAGRSRKVGEHVIRSMHARMTRTSWRLVNYPLNDRVPTLPYVDDPTLQPAIIVDIDGTLALHVNRGPYDFDKVETDAVNEPVRYLLNEWPSGDRVILLSGRQEEYRAHTERWLEANNISYDDLYMRGIGDRRSDDIVKGELFDACVRGRYRVRLVLDDRDRVVRLWRQIGLPCWQVNYGDF